MALRGKPCVIREGARNTAVFMKYKATCPRKAALIVISMLAALRQRAARSLSPLARQASTYSGRMDNTGRPISPHVFIYKFPTIAISSIMMRISGCVLTIGESAARCARGKHLARSYDIRTLLSRHDRHRVLDSPGWLRDDERFDAGERRPLATTLRQRT